MIGVLNLRNGVLRSIYTSAQSSEYFQNNVQFTLMYNVLVNGFYIEARRRKFFYGKIDCLTNKSVL